MLFLSLNPKFRFRINYFMKKRVPYRVALLVLLGIIIALNSVRLFLYGFIISFMIVIIDRAFFGNRKKSDYQFYNLFVVLTFIFSIAYTFSPAFRYFEFEISHPKWKKFEIVAIQKGTDRFYFVDDQLSSVATPIKVSYIETTNKVKVHNDTVRHYALYFPFSLGYEQTMKEELEYIHSRSMNNLMQKKGFHLFQNPRNQTMRTFFGNDAFALRHSRWFHIGLYMLFGLFIFTLFQLAFRFRTIIRNIKSTQTNKKIGGIIYISIFVLTLFLNVFLVIHYLRF